MPVFPNKIVVLSCIAAVALYPAVAAAEEINMEGLPSPFQSRAYSPYADRGFATDVYFGDTHVHTMLSADAGGGGTRLLPRDAYRFARGEQVISNTGQPAKLAQPLDFYMITDHSDGMGAIKDILAGTPEIMATEQGRQLNAAFNAGGDEALRAAQELVRLFGNGELDPALNYQPGNESFKRVWEDIMAAAEEYNDPGVFTTFVAFEWTSLVRGNNLHRNVIFRDGPARAGRVEPFTTSPPSGSLDPQDLWAWMQSYEDLTGGDVLAIPHNGNVSNGMMFPLRDDFDDGAPLDAAYAEQRQKWEPLYEAVQIKGDGEAHPSLSPADEFADFETWDYGNLDATEKKTTDMLPGEYVRSGLQRGMAFEQELGVNPYKIGLVGGSDNHIGMTTPDNDNFFGKFTAYEPSAERATHISRTYADGSPALYSWQYISSGLTAVWAEDNTRGALFDAMERKEAYATTGTRIRLRFFGGWDFQADDALSRNLAQVGYAKGVPMGSDLTAGEGAPSFLVYALRDPMGANLDRIQIIKLWLDSDGNQVEKVYDVAWSDSREMTAEGKLPSVGNTVDLTVPTWTNTIGASELGTVWQDPDFDPAQPASYYARVIEIPTPRWTAYDAVYYGLDLPADIPLQQQERAYSSPIWFTPEG